MPNNIAHFAIHADDCERAKAFYEQVFGWRFEPWGPPGFWLIDTNPNRAGVDGEDRDSQVSTAPIRGALQQRHSEVSGSGMIGFECTIAVEDVAATAAAVAKHGGTVVLQPMRIETVGTMIQFHDTEGNVVGAMQYDADVAGRQ